MLSESVSPVSQLRRKTRVRADFSLGPERREARVAYIPPRVRRRGLLVPSSWGDSVPTLDIAPTATATELVAFLDAWPASAIGVVALPPSGSDESDRTEPPNPN